MRRQLERETADREVLDDLSLMQSVPLGIVASILDVPTVLPFGQAVRGIKLGSAALTVGELTAACHH